jgi:hypothetical protein
MLPAFNLIVAKTTFNLSFISPFNHSSPCDEPVLDSKPHYESMLTSQTITLCPISVVFTVNQNSMGKKRDLSREMERKKEEEKRG